MIERGTISFPIAYYTDKGVTYPSFKDVRNKYIETYNYDILPKVKSLLLSKNIDTSVYGFTYNRSLPRGEGAYMDVKNMKILKEGGLTDLLREGDFIHDASEGYLLNDGLYLWDGNKPIVPLWKSFKQGGNQGYYRTFLSYYYKGKLQTLQLDISNRESIETDKILQDAIPFVGDVFYIRKIV